MFRGPKDFSQDTFMTNSWHIHDTAMTQSWHSHDTVMACLEREREREPERALIQVWRLTHRQRYHKVTYWAPFWSRKFALYLVFESQFSIHVIGLRLQKRCEHWTISIRYHISGQGPGPWAVSARWVCPESAIFSNNGIQRNAFYRTMVHFMEKFDKIRYLPRWKLE